MNNFLSFTPPTYSEIVVGLIISFISLLGIFLVFFLAIRWLLLWYWKVNKIVRLLEKIDINTQVIAKNTYREGVLEGDSGDQIIIK